MSEFKCKSKTAEGAECGHVLGKTDGIKFLFVGAGGVSLNYLPIICAKCGGTRIWKRLETKKSFDTRR
jgi:hypothetical protein